MKNFKYSLQQLYLCEIRDSDLDLDGLNLPQLTEKQIHLFDSPVTLNELYDALKQMKHGKSPGLDGSSYRAFSHLYFYLYLTLLLDIFQQVIREADGFHRDVNTAITLKKTREI